VALARGAGLRAALGFWAVVLNVELADLAFSLDNVVAAVALSRELWVILTGVCLGIVTMRFAAGIFVKLIQREPVLEAAAYLLVLAIGVQLMAEEFLHVHISHGQKFAISAATLGLCLLYAHVPLLQAAGRRMAWVAHVLAAGMVGVRWALGPVGWTARTLVRAAARPVGGRRCCPAPRAAPGRGTMGAARRSPFFLPRQTIAFRLSRGFVRALLRVYFLFRVEGLTGYAAGPGVIVANHTSALDPLFIAAALPDRVLFVAAREFLALPVVGWVMRAYGCIPVRRGEVDTSVVRLALRALAAGVKVGVFPEGRVSPQPGPLRRGAGLLAAAAGVPIQPIAVVGSGRAFPLGASFPRPARVTVRIGAQVPPPAGAGDDREAARADREATVAQAMAWVFAEVGRGYASAKETVRERRRNGRLRARRRGCATEAGRYIASVRTEP
jgi:1-acyl-sn-glycerol-3-phosphate acyltransferase